MTNRLEILDRSLVNTSVRPSLKYSCLGSSLMFTNGRTTMEGLSGKGSAGDCASGVCVIEVGEIGGRDAYHRMPQVMTSSATLAAIHRYIGLTCHDGFSLGALSAVLGVSCVSAASIPTRYTRTGLAMFFTV